MEAVTRYLVCPQCGINRFRVKNRDGDSTVVQVNRNLEIIPVKPETSLAGFDLTRLYCLGCSWKGSIRQLKKYL